MKGIEKNRTYFQVELIFYIMDLYLLLGEKTILDQQKG
jgi:hypothetical protein